MEILSFVIICTYIVYKKTCCHEGIIVCICCIIPYIYMFFVIQLYYIWKNAEIKSNQINTKDNWLVSLSV